ncbi:MAG: TonB-dependent receptor [Ignavibacteriae bacterium HGW-Ignavibacteriae-4]|nr:MAG: TonB-dependent receptor [Ignavibacteriae bacterium HGW-Ignavibacteriae-4]
MKKYLILIVLLFPVLVAAQTIKGVVMNTKHVSLIGANVYWEDSKVGTTTDSEGKFEISMKGITNKNLIASYVGHTADTVLVKDQKFVMIHLEENATSEAINVVAEKPGIIISNSSAIKTEQITQTELGKAACCDLAGAFETQITVQPQTTNVITNSKELRLLGLSGVYNQVLVDGFPMIMGLSYTYGISSIPGPLVDNIFVSKGANSVLQGFEGISGQINVITKERYNSDKLLVNIYMNSFMEKQLNANYTFKTGDWSNITSFHTTQPADKFDRDNDNFLDVPQITRYSLFNKWSMGDEHQLGWNSKITLRYLNENRAGGQTNYNADTDKGSSTVYGQSVDINQPEFSARVGYRLDETHDFQVFASGFYQDQKSYFGTVDYKANQTNLYGNLQYEMNYSDHTLKTGASIRYMNLNENVGFTENSLGRTYAGEYLKKETIPGLFAENTMNFLDDKLTWIAGVRVDNHNQFGTIFTPRTLVKYNATDNTTLRANIGTGWRTTNLFSENINLLVSSRDIVFAEAMKPEKALNYGFSLTQNFNTEDENVIGHFMADFYRTEFQNQIFPDYDSDPTKAIIKNFEDPSISNGLQLEFFVKLWDQVEFKAGYNYLDVYRVVDGVNEQLPFNSKHKVLASFSYKPLSKEYHFDVNLHWFGQQRLPITSSNPEEFQRPDFSDSYFVVNPQFTYSFEFFDVYLGCENLLDFRQERPIISWQNPFGPYFDTSSVWGPTKGREIYIGFNYRIPNE